MIYTDKTAKEIAYELGFDDAGHLENFLNGIQGWPRLNLKDDDC